MLTRLGNRLQPLGITLLRLAVGIDFLYHGSVKLSHLPQWTHNFAAMGFPPATAYGIGALETVGGALLILGLFSRIFGLLLAGDMAVALVRVNLPHTPILHVASYELTMLLAGASFLIFCLGSGPIAIDGLRGDRWR